MIVEIPSQRFTTRTGVHVLLGITVSCTIASGTSSAPRIEEVIIQTTEEAVRTLVKEEDPNDVIGDRDVIAERVGVILRAQMSAAGVVVEKVVFTGMRI
jgi:regulator of protease activity HflC (stomatin/prohibitin superfamily)